MNTTIKPRLWRRIEKYVKGKEVTIDLDDLERVGSDIMVLHRLKKDMGCPTLKDLRHDLNKRYKS